jgi:peptide/nickel transport system permease protein
MTARGTYVAKRLLQTIPLILGVLLLVFLLLEVTPGDPARTVAGPRASEAEVQQVREDLGLDKSLPERYFSYVQDAVTGDLGTSIRQRIPVTEVIGDRFSITIALIFFGSLFGLAISVPMAQWAARRKDRAPDHFVRAFSIVTLTMPAFWVGILLLVLVALPTGAFPISGYGETIPDHVRALVLPSLTLAISLAPLLIRSLRAEFISVRESDYVALARASGISPLRVALRHELPNAILPAITIVAVSVGFLLFGVVVVEDTFGLPGLGSAMTAAVDDNDFPVIQGITLVFALIVIAVYLVADILYTLIDPRVELR